MRKLLVFIISGKAQAGKDTTATFIKKIAEKKNLKVINLQFSSYIKMYAQNISNWNGDDKEKPRLLLQKLGKNIRNNIDKYFFINRIKTDIKVYQDYFDVITISDARLPEELNELDKEFKNSIKINIQRPNYNPYHNIAEKNDISETALDNYQNFDYKIINDGSLEDLYLKINDLLKNIL